MIQPISKFNDLYSELFETFSSKGLFEKKEFYFRNELRAFPEGSSLESDFLWAFYYASKGTPKKAIECFKRSISYGEPRFIQNYLSYLYHVGYIKKFISETNNAKNILTDINELARSLLNASFLSGNLDDMQKTFDQKSKFIENNRDAFRKDLELYHEFKNSLQLTNQQMESLFNYCVDIADEYRLTTLQISVEYDFDNIFILTLNTSDKDFKKLAKVDKELSDKVAENESLNDKVFGISVRSFDGKVLLED